MKQNYISAIKLSLWMRLVRKWNSLCGAVQIDKAISIGKLEKLNKLSLLLGIKRKLILTAAAGAVTLGAHAQISFEQVTDRTQQVFKTRVGVFRFASPSFGDIDGDGDADLVIGQYSGGLKYFKNNNNSFDEQIGTDSPFDGIELGQGSNLNPAFVDLDGDGDQDLVIGEYYGTLKFYQNNSGVFTEQTNANNPFDGIDIGGAAAPSFADLDGDGDQDLITGELYGHIKYYTNINNTFTEQTGSNNPFDGIDVRYSSQPIFEDIDGDSDLDLVLGTTLGEIKCYTNTNQVFTEQTGANNPFGGIDVGFSSIPSFTDLDNDGNQDLIVGNKAGFLNYFKNDASSYVEQTLADNPLNGVFAGGYVSPVFADVDNDSDLDLVLGEKYGELTYYTQNTGVFTEQTGVDNPFSAIDVRGNSAPMFIDADGDSDLDILVGKYEDGPYYYENVNGVYTFRYLAVDNPFSHIDVYESTPISVDLDNDGDLDLVFGEQYGSVFYYENNEGVFTEQTGVDNPFDGINVGRYSAPSFADLDIDGDQDLILGKRDGTLSYFENDGNNVFTEQTGVTNPFDNVDVGSSSRPKFADLDGDSDLDLFVGEALGNVIEFTNTSTVTGIFSKQEKGTLSIYPNPATSIIYIAEGETQFFDQLGNLVLTKQSNGKIDVSSLSSGIYIVSQGANKSKLIVE